MNSTKEVTNNNQLSIQLDLKTEDFKNIKGSYSNPEDVKTELYDHWIKNDPEASWLKLSKALRQMTGHFVLAQKIQRDYVDLEGNYNHDKPLIGQCILSSQQI